MSKSVLLRSVMLVLVGGLLPSFAHAHAGKAGGFMQGLMHPASGLDHVCAMLAVGLWAAQTGGRSVWVVPLAFVGVMALGGALPILGIALPFVEEGIVFSVLLLGVMITASIRLPLLLGGSMAGMFALWHGHAHASEMPAHLSGLLYTSGFVLTTALLHLAGIASDSGMQRFAPVNAMRFAGISTVLCGAYLATA